MSPTEHSYVEKKRIAATATRTPTPHRPTSTRRSPAKKAAPAPTPAPVIEDPDATINGPTNAGGANPMKKLSAPQLCGFTRPQSHSAAFSVSTAIAGSGMQKSNPFAKVASSCNFVDVESESDSEIDSPSPTPRGSGSFVDRLRGAAYNRRFLEAQRRIVAEERQVRYQEYLRQMESQRSHSRPVHICMLRSLIVEGRRYQHVLTKRQAVAPINIMSEDLNRRIVKQRRMMLASQNIGPVTAFDLKDDLSFRTLMKDVEVLLAPTEEPNDTLYSQIRNLNLFNTKLLVAKNVKTFRH